MSGNDEHNHHCRIGKVTPKKPIKLAKIRKKARGRVRSMLMEMVQAVDINAEKGHMPLCAFVTIVNEDGKVMMGNRFNKPTTGPNRKELDRLNWRHMAMLFEDAAQDCRNFTVYHQESAYDLVNEIQEAEEE